MSGEGTESLVIDKNLTRYMLKEIEMRSISMLVLIALLCGCDEWGSNMNSRETDDGDRCWPISSQSTGTIECWSGGILVYSNHIYHNGGVLCATDGHEIKITGGKSLCVIESNQDSAWKPPIATDTEQ